MEDALTAAEQTNRAKELDQQIRHKRLLASQARHNQAAASASGKDQGAVSPAGVLQKIKNILITTFFPGSGIIIWLSSRIKGEKMTPASWSRIIVLLIRKISGCLIGLLVLSLIVMVAAWIAAGFWETLALIWQAGWEGIKAIMDLFLSSK